MKPLAMALLLGGIALSFTACKKAVEAVEVVSKAAANAAGGDSKANTDSNVPGYSREKFNAYVECYNDADSGAHQAMRRYGQWVQNMDTGPTGKERTIYGTYTVPDHVVQKCSEMTALADAKPVIAELDGAAKNYAAALGAWAAKLQEADKYYSNQDYKDDQMAKGKAMHADFVAAYKAFDEASGQFSDALEEIGRKRRLEELAALEKSEGKKFRYWHLSTALNAESLVDYLREEEFDVEKAQQLIQAYEESSEALKNHAKSGEKDVPMMFSMYENELDAFLVTAKKRMRRVRDKEAYSTGERMNINSGNGWMVEGSRERLLRDYNELVEASNRLN
ncbi:MAG: YiiG family protein [Pseudomonadota bacterium]|nr:YiiG family protein [Pseudomonadota bacterium]